MSTASFLVGQSGEAYTLAVDAPPPTEIVVAGDTITFLGAVGTYDFIFSVVSPLTFGAPPVVEPIPSLPGVTFTAIVTEAFSRFKIQLNLTESPSVTYTVPFTINTSQGTFDPSIVIDPPIS